MKYLVLCAFAICLFACQEEAPKDYVTFSGKITNAKTDTIFIANRNFEKAIPLNKDGSFNDTLKVKTGMYYFTDKNESASVFLKNGYDLKMTIDTEEFDESIKYEGIGANENNFLAEKSLMEEKLFDQDFSELTREELTATIAESKTKINAFINGKTNIDTMLVRLNKEDIDPMLASFEGYYSELIALKEALPKGAKSPTFEGYVNYKGGTTSLADLKGKNVYIDVWATWCAPCKAEIPFLKELEHDYEGKNIEFVSLSIDDDRSHKGSWDLAKEDWRAMIADKDLGGIQIFAPEGWQSQFVKDYRIKGIPRFLLIDKDGNIVSANAPRPSDKKVRTMIDELI